MSPVQCPDSESKPEHSPVLLFRPLPARACVHASGMLGGHLCAMLGAERRPPSLRTPGRVTEERARPLPGTPWAALCPVGMRTSLEVTAGPGRQGNSVLASSRIDSVYLFCQASFTPNLGGGGGARDGGPEAPASEHGPFRAVINMAGVFYSISVSSLL